jgi:hypothetical protein
MLPCGSCRRLVCGGGSRRARRCHRTAGCRLTVTELAERVRLIAAPCHRWLRELERNGVITGYRAVLDRVAVGLGFEALVGVTMDREDADTSPPSKPRSPRYQRSGTQNGCSATPTTCCASSPRPERIRHAARPEAGHPARRPPSHLDHRDETRRRQPAAPTAGNPEPQDARRRRYLGQTAHQFTRETRLACFGEPRGNSHPISGRRRRESLVRRHGGDRPVICACLAGAVQLDSGPRGRRMWLRVMIFRDRAACNGRATPQPQSASARQRSQRPRVRKLGASVGNQPSQRWMENVHTACA